MCEEDAPRRSVGLAVGLVGDPYGHTPLWLKFAIQVLHDQIDQSNPNDPIRLALRKAGLERRP